MEIFVLIMLYYLSQNPDFLGKIQPLMGEIKNSQEMLKFISDLSKFSAVFNQGGGNTTQEKAQPKQNEKKEETKKSPASQTSGIADDFIEQCLENYFKNNGNKN